MKTSTSTPLPRRAAFTLIELLVVIAVIAILASLIFPITAGLKRKRLIAVAQTELAQIETAIEAYKASRGHYPPDNPDDPKLNQLYFELLGATNNGTSFVTKDGGQVAVGALNTAFGPKVLGLVNVSKTGNADDVSAATSFLTQLKPGQTGTLSTGPKVLTCSILWDQPASPPISGGVPVGMNPWRYVSSTPTNNPGSYDLWVDILIAGKTNRISNWSKVAQVVAY